MPCSVRAVPSLTLHSYKYLYNNALQNFSIVWSRQSPKKDFEAKAEEQWQQAVEQIRKYAEAPRVETLRQGTTLHKIIMQFEGWNLKRMEEVNWKQERLARNQNFLRAFLVSYALIS